MKLILITFFISCRSSTVAVILFGPLLSTVLSLVWCIVFRWKTQDEKSCSYYLFMCLDYLRYRDWGNFCGSTLVCSMMLLSCLRETFSFGYPTTNWIYHLLSYMTSKAILLCLYGIPLCGLHLFVRRRKVLLSMLNLMDVLSWTNSII